jgi:transcriptional regulator with XRE-family HTH domain
MKFSILRYDDQIKFKLVHCIRSIMLEKNLTQVKVQKLSGIGQPKLSHLLRGNTFAISVERLFWIINCLGYDVEIYITDISNEN